MLLKTDYIEVQTSYNLPIANFTANTTIIGVGEDVYFQDESLNFPTNWSWQFEGGSPETSTDENPTITYNYPWSIQCKVICF